MSWSVPLSQLELAEEDVEAVLAVLRSGWLTMGPNTERFEDALAEYLDVAHAIAVSSGSAALQLACLAAGLGPGDEAIVPSMTFVSTASAVLHAGATPVFCDVVGVHEPLLDVDGIERLLTSRTKAVVAVHLGGYAADLTSLRRLCDTNGLVLIEDVGQAIGARTNVPGRLAGTVGALGCFSFFSKTQLPTGEGGLVVTSDSALAARVRSLRSHGLTTSSWDRHRGHSDSYDVVDFGFNFRLDEARAALGLSRLERLARDIDGRRRVVRRYRELLASTSGLELPWSDDDVESSSHFAFFVLLESGEARDRFRARLAARDVQTTWYPAVHEFTAFRSLAPPDGLPLTEAFAARHCALPLGPRLADDALQVVVEAVREALAG